jgi:type IV pilus assembly protein PilP
VTLRLFCLAFVAAAVIAACGGSAPATPAAPASTPTAKAPKAGAADAGTAVAAQQFPYMYNPIGKRDPFRSPEEGLSRSTEKDIACNEPLCGFDLDQIQLVAVVSGDANPVAMVEDNQRIGYLVHRNSRVGKQGGKVTQIQHDCVVVTEYFQTPDGKVNPNRVNLCIKQDKRSVPVLDLLQNKLYEPQ